MRVNPLWFILLGVAFVITLFSFFYSIRGIKRQEKHELDKDIGQTLSRHQLLANPAVIVSGLGLLVVLALLVLSVF
jgi:hypothetical protein